MKTQNPTPVAGKKSAPVAAFPAEEIAEAVIRVAELGKLLSASRLGRRAQLLLIADATGVSMRDIGLVLDSLPTLASTYLKRT